MPAARHDRPYDLVLFGASGFAGELTAHYLARHAPGGTRWALAGRNRAKLENVRGRLAAIDPALSSLPLLAADATDPGSVRDLAKSSRVVITTVGPYIHYGEPLVAACAQEGTDYVDLTGEPEFVDTMYVRYHEAAVHSGARLVHACGFDSVPHDLGAYFTVLQLPEDVPVRISGYVQVSAAFSAGTLHSAVTAFSRGRQTLDAARRRRAADAPPPGRSVRYEPGRPHRLRAEPVGGWALPLPTIDGQIVVRSARALARYGPDFHYSHFAALPHLWTAAGGVAGIGALVGLAQIPPARRALLRRFTPGDGPSVQKRSRSWFRVTFVGEGGGKPVVVTRVSGGDPGYDETARMLAESALALAFDELPPVAGQVTPATAMGDALLSRLQAAGIRFEVI